MGFGKNNTGTIQRYQNRITVATLAANTALAVAGPSLTEDFRMLRLDYFLACHGLSADQPLIFGIANGELSVSEIKEALESTPLDRNDATGNERAHRAVWPLEVLMESSVGGVPAVKGSWKGRWTFSDTEAWQFFVYNPRTSAMTTGAVVEIIAKGYGVWV